jgi:hypothetical protein
MSVWKDVTKALKIAEIASKIGSWTKVPQLVLLNKIVKILSVLLELTKKQILKINEKYSDTVINSDAEANSDISQERTKPLPDQNNDVLREATRKRHEQSKSN